MRDGKTDSADAFQKALDTAGANGGGEVYVPRKKMRDAATHSAEDWVNMPR